jgi:hypothetical protein
LKIQEIDADETHMRMMASWSAGMISYQAEERVSLAKPFRYEVAEIACAACYEDLLSGFLAHASTLYHVPSANHFMLVMERIMKIE